MSAFHTALQLRWMTAAQAPSSQASKVKPWTMPAVSKGHRLPFFFAPVGGGGSNRTRRASPQNQGRDFPAPHPRSRVKTLTLECRHPGSWGHHTRGLRKRQGHGPGSHRPRALQSLPRVKKRMKLTVALGVVYPPQESHQQTAVWSLKSAQPA